MGLYTERHGMRNLVEKTYDISIRSYSILFDCCERYFNNLAWKYPKECPDEGACCGIDMVKFSEDVAFEIPDLFMRDGMIDKPQSTYNVFSASPTEDSFNQFALFDFIEYIGKNIRDISRTSFHSYYRHNHYSFSSTNTVISQYIDDINATFKKTGLLYSLSDDLEVERIEPTAVLSDEIESNIDQITEPGLKELLQTAIERHKSPDPSDQKDAVEKIWDAFERLKTYYTSLDKKHSADKIIDDMASSNQDFIDLFTNEFKALTSIGNNYRIRHHETDKFDITDQKHYDYFFNRCLSLIALAIQYLK